MLDKESISLWFQSLQLDIIKQLELADGKGKFVYDNWQREEGGGGKSSIIQDGNIIEKGGVNFSAVYGPTPEFLIKSKLEKLTLELITTSDIHISKIPHNALEDARAQARHLQKCLRLIRGGR
jgi:coproporphyrinogen III oxidase